ncbi:MAG TPA: DUF2218 domain-containing protein [Pseudohongiella sp.]|nr:DUF2218 domain-containing protein [Pseudohongiella sp.]
MSIATTSVRSENPQRILKRLCNHWSHRFQISSEREGHALIDLGERGVAEFSITGDILEVSARHEEERLPALKTAIENHLQRFAGDETLVFQWS